MMSKADFKNNSNSQKIFEPKIYIRNLNFRKKQMVRMMLMITMTMVMVMMMMIVMNGQRSELLSAQPRYLGGSMYFFCRVFFCYHAPNNSTGDHSGPF